MPSDSRWVGSMQKQKLKLMGNCIRHESRNSSDVDSVKKRRREVKIKIRKKELEELLAKVELKDLRVEQLLAHFMNQRPWRPALHTIPE